MVLAFATQLLDAAAAPAREAADLVDVSGRTCPPTACSTWPAAPRTSTCARWTSLPCPRGPARALFADAVVEAELRRLADGQRPDGGWAVDFASYSPAATLEWRGHRTVQALILLRANGVL